MVNVTTYILQRYAKTIKTSGVKDLKNVTSALVKRLEDTDVRRRTFYVYSDFSLASLSFLSIASFAFCFNRAMRSKA